MTTHREKRDLPYSAKQMYDLVADVESYPEFIPWTTGARVRDRKQVDHGEQMIADLVVSFKVFRERYTSRVNLYPSDGEKDARIDVVAIDGPFDTLETRYAFTPREDGGCTMALDVDFAFRSRLMQRAAGMAFELALKRVSRAFEERAKSIYTAAT